MSSSNWFGKSQNKWSEEFATEEEYLQSLKLEDQYHFSIPFEYIRKKYGDDDYDIAETLMEVDVVWDDSECGYKISYDVPEMDLIDPAEGNGNMQEFYEQDVWFKLQEIFDDTGIVPEAVCS